MAQWKFNLDDAHQGIPRELAAGVATRVFPGDEGATILDIFSPPRAEYRKAGSGYGDADGAGAPVG